MKSSTQKILLIVWIILILIMTGYPRLESPRINKIGIDKLYHFIIFFVMGLLSKKFMKAFVYFIFGTGIVLIAEVQQIFIPGREFEILDIVAGLLGLVVIYLIAEIRRSVRHEISKT